MKKMLAVFLSAVMLFSCFGTIMTASAETASNDGKISITSAADFQKIGTDTDFPLSGDYILANDIEITDDSYAPIGDFNNRFTGTFDGNGKTITVDLTYTKTDITTTNTRSTCAYVGLFGCVEGATIQNLTVTGTMDVTTVNGMIGGIIGGSYGATTVSKVTSDVDMTIDLVAGDTGVTDFISQMGGIVGGLYATGTSTENVSITDAYNKGNLTITNAATSTAAPVAEAAYLAGGRGGLGGIVGTSADYIAVTLTRCVNYGNITIDRGTHNTAGILGAGAYTGTAGKSITMSYCANHGDITRADQLYDRVTGLLGAGRVKISLDNCMNTGTISDENAVGFIGFFGAGDNYAANCFTTTAVGIFFEKYTDTSRTNQAKCLNNYTVADSTTVNGGTKLSAMSTTPVDLIFAELAEAYKGTDMEGKFTVGVIDGEVDIYFTFENPASYVAPAIEIDSAEEFAKIGVDAGYPLSERYVLTRDITITSDNYTPIGTYAAPFTGYFDGNGKTVTVDLTYTNLTATNTIAGCANVGLFGCIADATVTNLKVAGTMKVTTVCGYIGSIVGASYGASSLDGCVSDVDMTIVLDSAAVETLANAYQYPSYIGGMIGVFHQDQALNANGAASMTDCINLGDLDITTGINVVTAPSVETVYHLAAKGGYGGLVGISGANSAYEVQLTMTRCINYGDMTVNQGPQNIGGVMGMTSCIDSAKVTMTYCANYGNISRGTKYTDRVSAILGYARNADLAYCFNTGVISDSGVTSFLGWVSVKGTAEHCFTTTPVGYFVEAHGKVTDSATSLVFSDSRVDYNNGATVLSVASTDKEIDILNAIYNAMSADAKAVFAIAGITDENGEGAQMYFAEDKPTGINTLSYQVTDVNNQADDDATNDTYNIRFVSILDSLDYNKVGYDVVATYLVDGEEVSLTFHKECSYVYTSLTGSVEGQTVAYTVAGEYYLVALAITDVPANVGEVTFEVTAFTVKGETTTYGETVTCVYDPAA